MHGKVTDIFSEQFNQPSANKILRCDSAHLLKNKRMMRKQQVCAKAHGLFDYLICRIQRNVYGMDLLVTPARKQTDIVPLLRKGCRRKGFEFFYNLTASHKVSPFFLIYSIFKITIQAKHNIT